MASSENDRFICACCKMSYSDIPMARLMVDGKPYCIKCFRFGPEGIRRIADLHDQLAEVRTERERLRGEYFTAANQLLEAERQRDAAWEALDTVIDLLRIQRTTK